ncbi:MAG: bifunctional 2-polyprenyl-6-hydroxyphenol methylase/3-demethylubiquinol 3-O-methyltransferase UbiG [Alphaproteobacteria bacterium]|nr:bifunctional 2-polyprenyl-6-hydroxyphenol methylase/3-demethylubiquinol 3-O-methyltransferase UbiG [Alphaproteobacteria bacterium]
MTPTTPPHSSIDVSEIQRFSKISSQWWDENGPFKPLHQLNPARIQYIRDCLAAHFQRNSKESFPLKGLSILDIGCGGGLVAEPLTRLGAQITGIDASKEAIEVAAAHAALMELPIDYQCISAEELVTQKKTYDVVLALEIVEHVADVPGFLSTCTELIKPQGALILTTLNRTWKSYAFAIIGAEYIMRLLPVGTHDWNKFLSPAELASYLRPLGFSFMNLRGLSYNLFKNKWHISSDLDVNYMGCATKD